MKLDSLAGIKLADAQVEEAQAIFRLFASEINTIPSRFEISTQNIELNSSSVRVLINNLHEIIRLRAIQVVPESTNRERVEARKESRRIFEFYSNVFVELEPVPQLFVAQALFYLKPDSMSFGRKLSRYHPLMPCIAKRNLASLDLLLGYSAEFMRVSPYYECLSPANYIERSETISANKRQYEVRIGMYQEKKQYYRTQQLRRTILLGCSTMDALVFHRDNSYWATVSIPGLRWHDITQNLLDTVISLVSKNESRQTEGPVKFDIMIGFAEITSILNDRDHEGYGQSYGERICQRLENLNYPIAIHANFFPINEVLLNLPSVYGTLARNAGARDIFLELRSVTENMSRLMPYQVDHCILFAQAEFMHPDYVVHQHELHYKLSMDLHKIISIS